MRNADPSSAQARDPASRDAIVVAYGDGQLFFSPRLQRLPAPKKKPHLSGFFPHALVLKDFVNLNSAK